MSPCRGAPRQGLSILVFHGAAGTTMVKNEWTDAKIRPWEAVLEQLIETGPGDIAGVVARAFDLAMRDASASAVSGPGWTRARPSAGAGRMSSMISPP